MRKFIQENIRTRQAASIILIIAFLGLYCQVAQISLFVPLFLMVLGVHLFLIRQASLKLFLQLGLLLSLIVFVAHALTEYSTLPSLYVPVAAVGIIVMLLFNDLSLAFLMSLGSSVLVTLYLNAQLSIMLTFFIGSITGAFIVGNARTRGRLIGAGLYVGLMQVVSIILFYPSQTLIMTRQYVLQVMLPLLLNGFVGALFVSATLKIFESWFGVLTNFSLLELSDFNHPLLKRMILEAPGTYHHSLLVSNLAEAAADAIDANSLLTRVGAYYHDIGKMGKAQYFTENQLLGTNVHDKIEPSISRLVIFNHVKEGIEVAKKNKLNPLIINFIPQHHGTSLMHYFYQKALEEAEDATTVHEENYRYPGPKPQTRETAIVLLADSVEAATRSLEEFSPPRIEETVRKFINNKFIDGQLDECNLTLKEINLIAETFTRVLAAMYHARVKYPEKKNGDENRNRKPAEENSS